MMMMVVMMMMFPTLHDAKVDFPWPRLIGGKPGHPNITGAFADDSL